MILHKNRGMFLETVLNLTCNFYIKNNLAHIEKKHVELKNASNKNIAKGKSTVDYWGCLKGNFIAFEAKSTHGTRIEKSNFKLHQLEFLLKIKKFGGISFYVLYFFTENKFLIVEPETIENFMIEDISITYLNIKKYSKEVELTFPGILDFIPIIS